MRRTVFSTAAERQLREVAIWLARASANREVGKSFARALAAQCEKLAALPGQLGRARDELAPGVRSFAFRGYVIFFRYGEDVFDVVAILHERQDVATHWGDDAPDA